MAIVQTYEIAEGRSVSGTARETFTYQRSFAIKIDDPATPMDEIAQAPGIVFGAPHPDDPSVFAKSFDCSISDDLLLYKLNVTYEAPPLIDASSDGPGSADGVSGDSYDFAAAPADTWSGSSGVTLVPIDKHLVTGFLEEGGPEQIKAPILNTAGQPIPDLQAEKAMASLSLTRSYPTAAAAATALTYYVNKINRDEWAGTPEKTWKCQGGSWQKQTQSSGGINLTYYSATFNFSYDSEGWILEQIMIGTIDALGRNITEADVTEGYFAGKPQSPQITEPVGLNEQGFPVPRTTPPTKPYVASYDIYFEEEFTPYFGTPS